MKITKMAVLACPNLMNDPNHFKGKFSCRCHNPKAEELRELGLQWNGFFWSREGSYG